MKICPFRYLAGGIPRCSASLKCGLCDKRCYDERQDGVETIKSIKLDAYISQGGLGRTGKE